MSKTYIVEQNIKEWLDAHQDEIFDDILLACEKSLVEENERVLVATIRTMYGVTLFTLSTTSDIISSLKKCEIRYVELEEYEKAHRAFECGNMWADHQRYIKKITE